MSFGNLGRSIFLLSPFPKMSDAPTAGHLPYHIHVAVSSPFPADSDTANCAVYDLTVPAGDRTTVADVKAFVNAWTGVDSARMELEFKGTKMRPDAAKIWRFGIRKADMGKEDTDTVYCKT